MDNIKSTVIREGAPEGTVGSDKAKDGKNKSSSSKEGRTRMRNFTPLRPGDHIKMLRWFIIEYWHHAIVKEVISDETMKLKVIHFSNPDEEKNICKKVINFCRRGKAEIFEEKIGVEKVSNCFGKCVYRVEYGSEVLCNKPEDVIEIAKKMADDHKNFPPEWGKRYCLCSNNCEHLARQCKIGTKQCLQKKAAALKAVTCCGNIISNVAISVVKFLANVLDDIAAVALAKVQHWISSVPTIITSAVGLGFYILVEVICLIVDIVKQKRLRKKNLITVEEFKFFRKHRIWRFGVTVVINIVITMLVAVIAASATNSEDDVIDDIIADIFGSVAGVLISQFVGHLVEVCIMSRCDNYAADITEDMDTDKMPEKDQDRNTISTTSFSSNTVVNGHIDVEIEMD